MKTLISFILVIFLSFFAIKPLLIPGFYPMHDDTQPSRVYEMAQALKEGQFPVRWVGDLGYGYGYPLFNFYAPLPYYVGALFNLPGIDALNSAKLMIIIGTLLSGLTMYLLASEIAGKIAGVSIATLYVYAPYHALNIYVRGAIGELYAYAFLPLIFLGILKMIKARNLSESRVGILLGSLGYASLLLSHNILGLLTSYLLFVGLIIYALLVIIKKKNKFTIYYLLFTALLGFGLSAFFTLPALFEKKYTRVDSLAIGTNDFHNHFVYPDQLWDSPWGYAGSAPGKEDGMSFKVGKIHLLLGFAGIFYALILWRKKHFNNFLLWVLSFQFTVFIISIFFMLEQSKFLWEILPGFTFIQYPWRFLNYIIFSLSIITSFLFLLQSKKFQILISIIIISLVFWLNLKYFRPQTILSLYDLDYISGFNLNNKISRISDEYMPPNFVNTKVGSYSLSLNSNLFFKVEEVIKESPTEKIYRVDSLQSQRIVADIAYFPGWQVFVDGKRAVAKGVDGKISFNLFLGKHEVLFKLSNTAIRIVANSISLLCVFLLIYVSLFLPQPWLKRRNQSK